VICFFSDAIKLFVAQYTINNRSQEQKTICLCRQSVNFRQSCHTLWTLMTSAVPGRFSPSPERPNNKSQISQWYFVSITVYSV